MKSAVRLRPDEVAEIENSQRCAACAHLDLFHHSHDLGSYCLIGDCPCVDGEMPEQTVVRPVESFRRLRCEYKSAPHLVHRVPVDCYSTWNTHRKTGYEPARLAQINGTPDDHDYFTCRCGTEHVWEGDEVVLREVADRYKSRGLHVEWDR